MTDDRENELEWRAFLYVSGEMSAEEHDAFEDRLAIDQEAREAVAQAVDLIGQVAVVQLVPVTEQKSPPARRTARVLGIIASIAAALLVGLVLSIGLKNRTQQTERARLEPQHTEELISLYVASPIPDAEDHGSPADGPATSQPEEQMHDGDESELQVPSWLIAAVDLDLDDSTEEN